MMQTEANATLAPVIKVRTENRWVTEEDKVILEDNGKVNGLQPPSPLLFYCGFENIPNPNQHCGFLGSVSRVEGVSSAPCTN